MPTAIDWNNPVVQDKIGRADIMVWQRNVIAPEIWAAMDYWRALGKPQIVDLDDSYPQLPPSNPAYQFWIRNVANIHPDPVERLAEGLRHADALTSPSKVLLKDWEHIVPGYWVPNWTRKKWYEPVTQKPVGGPDLMFGYEKDAEDGPVKLVGRERPNSAGEIILGWGGSISHVDSWVYSGLPEALDIVFAKYPNVRLKFCGGEGRLDYIFDRFPGKIIKQGGVSPEHWPFVVSSFDIGLAPLDLREIPPYGEHSMAASYDERRSWLKAAEYLTAGVPWIATRCKTYADLAHMGTVVENTAEAWATVLENKITRLTEAKAEAWRKRDWALRKITLEANVKNYGDIFSRIATETAGRRGVKLPGVEYV